MSSEINVSFTSLLPLIFLSFDLLQYLTTYHAALPQCHPPLLALTDLLTWMRSLHCCKVFKQNVFSGIFYIFHPLFFCWTFKFSPFFPHIYLFSILLFLIGRMSNSKTNTHTRTLANIDMVCIYFPFGKGVTLLRARCFSFSSRGFHQAFYFNSSKVLKARLMPQRVGELSALWQC